MIDEQKLIADIRYSEQWQNSKCPEWVIRMIESQPTRTGGRKLSEVLGTMFDEEEVENEIGNKLRSQNKHHR